MDILYRRGRATAGEVMEDLSGDPSYSTVRTQLRVLESKGHVRHDEEGLRYVYMPAVRRQRRGSPPSGTSLIPSLMVPPKRSSAHSWAATVAGSPKRNWSESPDWWPKRRKKAHDERPARQYAEGFRDRADGALRRGGAAPPIGCGAALGAVCRHHLRGRRTRAQPGRAVVAPRFQHAVPGSEDGAIRARHQHVDRVRGAVSRE